MTIEQAVAEAAKRWNVDAGDLRERVDEALYEAPENFYADGERTTEEAVDYIARRMATSVAGQWRTLINSDS